MAGFRPSSKILGILEAVSLFKYYGMGFRYIYLSTFHDRVFHKHQLGTWIWQLLGYTQSLMEADWLKWCYLNSGKRLRAPRLEYRNGSTRTVFEDSKGKATTLFPAKGHQQLCSLSLLILSHSFDFTANCLLSSLFNLHSPIPSYSRSTTCKQLWRPSPCTSHHQHTLPTP